MEMKGGTANLLLMILISSMTVIVPLLLNQASTVFYLSTPFYITIVVLYFSVLYLRVWGILITAITLIVSGLFLEIPQDLFITNTFVNIIQIIILYIATTYLRSPKRRKTELHYQKGEFYFSFYNLCIICLLFVYGVLGLFVQDEILTVIIVLSSVLLLATLIKAYRNSDPILLKYTIIVAFLPSALCSFISAYLCHVPENLVIDYCLTWTLSNYIFLQTIGYIIFQIFYVRRIHGYKHNDIVKVSLSRAVYYISIVIINLLIIYLYYSKIIGSYGYVYFFPWLLGNIFLLSNFYFSKFDDATGVKEENRFDWYEKRIITIEKNTSGIITIISFILPLSVTLMRESMPIPSELVILFASNIFFACLSVGLIWIPNKNLRFISLLKSVKTIAYTYSITLLLISTILIMFTSIE